MPRKMTKEESVKKLVKSHFKSDKSIDRIIWAKNSKGMEIYLIDIDKDTFPTGEFMPFRFGPPEGSEYPVKIALLTPEEWEQVNCRKIKMPEEWSLEDAKEFMRGDV